MNKLFKRGYDIVREEKVRQDKARENAGNKLWTFYLKENEEAKIRFLTEEPVSFLAHVTTNGKYDTIVCPEKDCKYCEDGDRPSFKGAYLIIDKREFEMTNKKTNKKEIRKAVLRLYIVGTQILSQLDRYSSKYGLIKRDYTIAKNGSGQNTTFSFDPEEPSKITKEEISNLMTEKMREQYDGSTESLMKILEGQLERLLPNTTVSEDEEVEEPKNNALIDVDDEEEAEQIKKPRIKPPSVKSLFKKK